MPSLKLTAPSTKVVEGNTVWETGQVQQVSEETAKRLIAKRPNIWELDGRADTPTETPVKDADLRPTAEHITEVGDETHASKAEASKKPAPKSVSKSKRPSTQE